MNRVLIAFVLLIVCSVSLAGPVQGAALNAKTTVLMVDKGPSGIIYTINSQPTHGLFKNLIEAHKEGATKLTILMNEKISLKQLGNITELAAKADFVGPDVRVFVFNNDKEGMQEITLSQPYIFSEKVDDLKLLHPYPADLKK